MVADAVAASVLLLIVFLILFAIKRWYGIDIFHENSAMQKINSRPPVLDVVNVDKPFSIELGKQPFENDQLIVNVTAKRTCDIRSFWNVNLAKAIELFHSSLAENQATSGVQLTDYLTKCCSIQNENKIIHPTNQMTYSYAVCADDLDRILEEEAASPAKLSTLIVSVELLKDACREAVFNEDIVCLLSSFIVERNGSYGRKTWRIGYQIIQTADGRLFTLKNLYASGVPDLDTATTPTASVASDSQPDLCVICHSNHVTRALLPCRHQCICGACFRRTKLCPVCRRPVTSYLVTCDESHLPMPIPDEEELAEQTREGLNSMGLVELIRAVWNAS